MRLQLARWVKKPFFGRFAGNWRWPSDISREDWFEVQIPSVDKVTIQAVLGRCEGEAKGTLVLAHPMGRTAKGFWLKNGQAQFFREQGYHVLAFDFNGFGESDNGSLDYPEDVLAVGRWLKQAYPDLDCGIVGASFGGAWALCAMSRSNLFKAALIEATFPKLADFWRPYPIPNAILKFCGLVLPKRERRVRPAHAAQHIQGAAPVTLIYSKDDPHTPPAFAQQLQRALQKSTQVKLFWAEHAEHTFIFNQARPVYEDAAQHFMQQMVS